MSARSHKRCFGENSRQRTFSVNYSVIVFVLTLPFSLSKHAAFLDYQILAILHSFQWFAGNLACKGLMMIRTGGYILSSAMLAVVSIDR